MTTNSYHTSLRLGLILAALFGMINSAQASLNRVSDFALLDSQGSFHQLSRYLHKEAVVLMSYAASCESMGKKVAEFKAAQTKWQQENLVFLLIDSGGSGRKALADLNLELPVLDDSSQLVSESLGFAHAGEVLILNPERSSVYYRGAAGNSLQQAIAEVLAGTVSDTILSASNDTETTGTEAIETVTSGCDTEYPVAEQHSARTPDYSTEVAPIISKNCAECHRQGGVGPFALDSHIMVMGWSPMIREVLLNKRMPPTQIDPYIGHSKDARYLSDADLQTLVHWIDAGAPRQDEAEDPLEQVNFPERDKWVLGEPDYIVTGPDNEVPSTGVMDYIYTNIDLPFEEDKWLKAVQYLAGDESVLHHLMTYVTAPGEDFFAGERESKSLQRRFVAGYAPGAISPLQYPDDTGVLIPAGHRLSMQFHYVTNGKSTVDTPKLGLYFYETPPPHEYLTQAVSAGFEIPANEANYALVADHVFNEEVIITGLRAHMHFRGKHMKFSAQQADGSWKDLLSIPAYNYGWQPQYQLQDPELIPAGTKIRVSGAFDNSRSNPSNPDPNKTIGFGLDSWDEMFSGYISFHKTN